MKVKSTTIVFILAILFILIGGLSYFFYIKYNSSMNYVNEQFSNYNLHIQKQLSGIMDQYNNYLSFKNKSSSPYNSPKKSIVENGSYEITEEEQNSVINQLHQELKTIEEEDLGYKSDDEYISYSEQVENSEESEKEVMMSLDEEYQEDEEDEEDEEEEQDEEQEIECNSNSCTLVNQRDQKEIDEKELDSIIQSLENQQETLPMISSDEENSIDINF
jgi:hypothetical protein